MNRRRNKSVYRKKGRYIFGFGTQICLNNLFVNVTHREMDDKLCSRDNRIKDTFRVKSSILGLSYKLELPLNILFTLLAGNTGTKTHFLSRRCIPQCCQRHKKQVLTQRKTPYAIHLEHQNRLDNQILCLIKKNELSSRKKS